MNKTKPRILQIHSIVSDRSVIQAANTRGVRPEISEIKPATEEPQNNTVHEFERSNFCDKTEIFKILPIIPNMNIIVAN